jgi:hypothetical protein
MTSAKRRQLPCLGSPNKNPISIGKVQQAVEGRVIFLIMVWPSAGKWSGYFKSRIIS